LENFDGGRTDKEGHENKAREDDRLTKNTVRNLKEGDFGGNMVCSPESKKFKQLHNPSIYGASTMDVTVATTTSLTFTDQGFEPLKQKFQFYTKDLEDIAHHEKTHVLYLGPITLYACLVYMNATTWMLAEATLADYEGQYCLFCLLHFDSFALPAEYSASTIFCELDVNGMGNCMQCFPSLRDLVFEVKDLNQKRKKAESKHSKKLIFNVKSK
jgi:hypothetical protein